MAITSRIIENDRTLHEASAPAHIGRAKPDLKVLTPKPQRRREDAQPSLRPRQRVLERRLRGKAHDAYRGLSWMERTLRFTQEWDLARKRQLGCLNSYFATFGPRWEHPQWWDFVQARRLADLFGARYDQWIDATVAHELEQGSREVSPSHLHGKKAVASYLGQHGKLAPGMGQDRPFDQDTFDRSQPSHALYVTNVICEMIEVVRMLGDGKGLNTDGLSSDDLWLSLSTLDMGWVQHLAR